MKKVKITESQKAMLVLLDGVNIQEITESIPRSQSPSAKVTDTFKSEVKGIKGFKAENTNPPLGAVIIGVEWSELVPKVLDFIKKLYTNPSKEGLDPFWGQVGLTWDEMIQMLTALDLIKSVDGGYRLTKFVDDPTKNVKVVAKLIEKMMNDKHKPKEEPEEEPEVAETTQADIAKSFKNQVSQPKKTNKTRQELLDVIAKKRAEELDRREKEAKGLEEGDWFDSHPDHPANQVDRTQSGRRPESTSYNIVWFSDDISIFEKDGQYFVYNVTLADSDEYGEYADREQLDMGTDEDGFPNVEYGEWSLDSDTVNAYVNDNLSHLSFGRGLDDYENGKDMTILTQDLATDLISFANYIGGEEGAKLNKILTSINLEEMTSLGGGALGDVPVGKMGGSSAPIHKGNVSSEIDMITDGETADEMSVEGDIIKSLKKLTLDGNVDVAEWFSFESELKRIVDLIQSLNNEEWNPVIMFIIKSLQTAESVMGGNHNEVTKFKQYLRSLAQFINHFSSSIGEAPTIRSENQSPIKEKDSELLDEGVKSWIAGVMMALATALPKTAEAQQDGVVSWDTVSDTVERVRKGTPGGKIKTITNTIHKIYNDSNGNVTKIVSDLEKYITKLNSDEMDSSTVGGNTKTDILDPKTDKMITLVNITSRDGESVEGPNKYLKVDGNYLKDPYLIKKDYYKDKELDDKYYKYEKEYNRLLSLHNLPPFTPDNKVVEMDTIDGGGDSGNFAFDVPMGDGSDFWHAGNKMAKKKSVTEDAKTDTQYPNGEFVEFDDCVKLNNNKVAQNGGCSTGAVDNVVKTRSSKNSVISDNALYSEISKATGRTISEVKALIENKINETR